MMNEQNNQDSNQQDLQSQNQDNRFDYMDQKPHYGRKELTLLGIAIAVTLALIFGGVVFVASNALEALAESDIGQTIADFTSKKEEVPDQEEMICEQEITPEESVMSNSEEEESNDDTPEYTEESIALALYEVPLSDNIVVTTSTDEKHAGYYVLQPDTIYAICWDASPLYRNSEGNVEANITISSDFLIGGGIDGEGIITVNIHDYHRHTDYVGELHIAADDSNLGIEFCSEECRRYAYGWEPQIEDGKFTLCFYTSGEYVESVSDGIYGGDGHYGFTYGTDGSEMMNDVVTRSPIPKCDPVPTPMPSSEDASAPTPMPEEPEPILTPAPNPVPTPPPANPVPTCPDKY